jgi:hypothetical protein
MEINFHLRSMDATGTAFVRKPGGQAAKAVQEEVAFENSRALTTALKNTPESREDVVRRATELIGDVNYPPPDTIRMISNLLAIQMQSESGADRS